MLRNVWGQRLAASHLQEPEKFETFFPTLVIVSGAPGKLRLCLACLSKLFLFASFIIRQQRFQLLRQPQPFRLPARLPLFPQQADPLLGQMAGTFFCFFFINSLPDCWHVSFLGCTS